MKKTLRLLAYALVCALAVQLLCGVQVFAADKGNSSASPEGTLKDCGTDLIRAADIAGIKFSADVPLTSVSAGKGIIEISYTSDKGKPVTVRKQADEPVPAPKGKKVTLSNGVRFTAETKNKKITKAYLTAESGSFTVSCASGLTKKELSQVYDVIAYAENTDISAGAMFSLADSVNAARAKKEAGTYKEAADISGIHVPQFFGAYRYYAEKGKAGVLGYDENGTLKYYQISSGKFTMPSGTDSYVKTVKSGGKSCAYFSFDTGCCGAAAVSGGKTYMILSGKNEKPEDICSELTGMMGVITRAKGTWVLTCGEGAEKIVLDGKGGFTTYDGKGKKLNKGYIDYYDEYGSGSWFYYMYDKKSGEFAGGFFFDSDTSFHIGNSLDVIYTRKG